MSRRSRRGQRDRRRKAAEDALWPKCVKCRKRRSIVDECDAGVCRLCHFAVTSSIAFPECKNFASRCAVLPIADELGRYERRLRED